MVKDIIIPYLKKYRLYLLGIIALTCCVSGITIYMPYANQNLFDLGLGSLNVSITIYYALLIIGLSLTSRLLEYFENKLELTMCNRIGNAWKEEAFQHGLNLQPSYFKEDSFFQIIRNATYDIDCIINTFQNYFLKVIVVLMRALGAIIGLVLLNWKLSLVVLFAVPLKYIANLIIERHELKYSEECLASSKRYNRWFNDFANGVLDIKLWGLERRKLTEFHDLLNEQTEAFQMATLLGSKANLTFFSIEKFFSYGLYSIGIVMILHHQLTLGSLISFVTYSSSFFAPIDILLTSKRMIKKIQPNCDSLRMFYTMAEESDPNSVSLSDPINTIRFDDVSIKLGGKEILNHFTYTFHRGDKILILGENGCGKSTLLNLLLRIYSPTSGQIYINDIPISKLNISDYRHHFSVVCQEIHLFDGTVHDNINLDSAQLKSSISAPKFCDSSIRQLNQQYNTHVGVSGTKLSGGERQKVALLRALNRKSDIIVLDEPTSNYDHDSEIAFNNYIAESHDYGFYFVVSHRPELTSFADVVLTISNEAIKIDRKQE